jgi:hypothetical protein
MSPTNPSESDKFRKDYHKFADDQVNNRADDEGIGRLRLALFIAALGPGGGILLHTIQYDPERFIKMGMLLSAPVSIVILIVNFLRLPNRVKGRPSTLTIILMTLVAAASTYFVLQRFSLLPSSPVS